MFLSTIGERIEKLRCEHNWSVTQLARLVGTNVKSVREWEENISCPSAQNIKRLCSIFSVTADYLLCIDNTPTLRLDGLSSVDATRARKIIQVLLDTTNPQTLDG